MTRGPIADLLAMAMVGVACFHASRLALASLRRGSTDVDVDVVHMVMGVSMAGMLTSALTGAWNDAWIVVFGASTVWFGRGIMRNLSDARAAGSAVTHHLPHFVVSAVMLYMLLAMRWTSMSGARMGQMSPTAKVGDSLLLPSVLAVLVVANAGIVVWRAFTTTAAPAFTRSPAAVVVQVAPSAAARRPGAARLRSPEVTGRRVATLAPRGAPACLLVMSVAMAYMVVVAHP